MSIAGNNNTVVISKNFIDCPQADTEWPWQVCAAMYM